MFENNQPALVLIDLQKGFNEISHWGSERNNPQAEKIVRELLLIWRIRSWPVIHVKHNSTSASSPLAPGSVGNEFIDLTAPLSHEPVFEKTVNSAFIGTDLDASLRSKAIDSLVVCGLTTDHCISTSVRMASNLGFKVWLVEDACATFDKTGPDLIHYPAEIIHRINLASLNGEFARVVSSAELKEQLN